jgi:hypothetical protein
VSEDAGCDSCYKVEVFFASGVGEGASFSMGDCERVASGEDGEFSNCGECNV